MMYYLFVYILKVKRENSIIFLLVVILKWEWGIWIIIRVSFKLLLSEKRYYYDRMTQQPQLCWL